jgi:hypothetical protein
MCVEQVERRALVERQILAHLAAAGAEVDVPTADEARAEFDAMLIAEPVPVPANVLMLRRLGVA